MNAQMFMAIVAILVRIMSVFQNTNCFSLQQLRQFDSVWHQTHQYCML
jgi:hypothetical protein